jgi:hypothetical protein
MDAGHGQTVLLALARSVGELQRLVVRKIVRRRFVTFRQRPLRETLEVGDAGIAPPFGLAMLNFEEGLDLRKALGVDKRPHFVPRHLHLPDLRDTPEGVSVVHGGGLAVCLSIDQGSHANRVQVPERVSAIQLIEALNCCSMSEEFVDGVTSPLRAPAM